MVLDENWGISTARMADFLSGMPDVTIGDGVFFFPECRVRLTPLTGSALGKWSIPRTRVEITGRAEAVRELHRRIFLRFLSAGG